MNRAEILDTAKNCVCGHRENEYGNPEDNFATIAQLWTTYLDSAYKDICLPVDGITAADVAVMMALLKIARIATGTATSDSFVDLAGYAACGGEIATRWADSQVNEDE